MPITLIVWGGGVNLHKNIKMKTSCLIIIFITSLSFKGNCQPQPKPIYEVINKRFDNRGLVNSLDIFIVGEAAIKGLNQILFEKYKSTGVASLQIFYFNDRAVAKTYSKKLFDRSTSDAEIEQMNKHLIGKFDYIAINNSQALHIGKEAQEY